MKFISFYILYSILWLLTRLPFRTIYIISDILFPLFYYLIPYRKKLVKTNLRNSFPEWDKKKTNKTCRQFYSFLLDSMFESMISSFISEKDILKRYKYRNPEVCNEIFDNGKSILLLMSHFANWEWSNSMPLVLKHKIIAVYKPLHNPWYDDFIKKSRERFGLLTIPMDKTLRTITSFQKDKIYSLSMFLSDQRPRFAQIQYWTKFLNQDTPVILGPEKIAKKLDEAVVFFNIIPVKRGYYEIEFDLLFQHPNETETFEITDAYFSRLEKMIRDYPQYWLWTHHRWKHDKVLFDKLKAEKSPV